MSPRRPKKPDELPKGSGRPVVEGARRALRGPDPDPPPGPAWTKFVSELRRELFALPEGGFVEGFEAEKHLRDEVCPGGVANPLGPYIPVPRPENTYEIGGQGKYVLFEPFMFEFFEHMTPEIAAAVIVMAKRQVRRKILKQIVKENWIRAGAIGTTMFAVFQWGVTAWEWVVAHLPAIQGLLKLLRTGGMP